MQSLSLNLHSSTTMEGRKSGPDPVQDLGKLIELWPYQMSTNGCGSPSEMTREYLRSLGLSREAQSLQMVKPITEFVHLSYRLHTTQAWYCYMDVV